MNTTGATNEYVKEPKCCCCGVRLGLGILYVLIFIGGVLTIATTFTGTTYAYGFGAIIAVNVISGVLRLIASGVGLVSIKKMESTWAGKAIKAFIGLFVLTWIMDIIVIILFNVYFEDIVNKSIELTPIFLIAKRSL